MLPDPITSYKYDRTSTITFHKVASSVNYAKYAASTNTATSKIIAEVRYRRSNRRTVKKISESGLAALPIENVACTVKVTRSDWSADYNRWVTAQAVCAYTVESQIDTSEPEFLDDVIAAAAFFPLTSTTLTKLKNEEV